MPSKPERDEVEQKAETTNEMIDWIDNIIVPALVRHFLREKNPMLKEKD